MRFASLYISVWKPTTDGSPTMRVRTAVLGATGYTALELIKILLRHPSAEIAAVTSRQDDCPAIAEVHPSLAKRLDLRCAPLDPDRLIAKGVPFVFGRRPHRASIAALPRL